MLSLKRIEITLSVALLFLFVSCADTTKSDEKTMEKDGGVRITVAIDVLGLVDQLAGTPSQRNFRKAMDETLRTFSDDYRTDFVTEFLANIKNENPDLKLAFIFNLGNRDMFDEDLSNKEVEEVLRKQIERALDRSAFILETRLEKALTQNINVQTRQNKNSLVIDIPGGKAEEKKRLLQIIQLTAFVGFWEDFDQNEAAKLGGGWPTMDGSVITDAKVNLNKRTNRYNVDLFLNSQGARIWEDLTERNIGKPITITVDGQVIFAPVVQEKMTGGRITIDGHFPKQDALDLANLINAGALPCAVKIIDFEYVNPVK
jgi:preprotein translocase subunit SecD